MEKLAMYCIYPSNPMANEAMAVDLTVFVDTMIEKLNKNAHKDAVALPDVPALLERLMGETGEFIRQYMENPRDPNATRELADIANFAFLISTVLPK